MSENGAVRCWGVHNNEPSLDFVAGGFIAIGGEIPGDMGVLGRDREALRARMTSELPSTTNKRAIAGWTGITVRFVDAISVGDLIVHPVKSDSTIAIGKVTSEYFYTGAESSRPHRRNVEWLQVGVPRTSFTQEALYEFGSFLSVFEIRRHIDDVLLVLEDGPVEITEAPALTGDVIDESAADAISASRIEEATADFVIRTIMESLEGFEFEHLVADVLRAMGYETRVTQASADGGVDIIVSKDRLGLEPPLIKVQCKRMTGTIGGPDAQALVGTLSPGGGERAMFVTLGGFSSAARALAQTRHDLRLIDGPTFVSLLLANYERLSPRYRRLLPLRSVYVVDLDQGLA